MAPLVTTVRRHGRDRCPFRQVLYNIVHAQYNPSHLFEQQKGDKIRFFLFKFYINVNDKQTN